METFLQDFPDLNPEENEEVADALATVLQYKKKGKGKSKGQSSAHSQSVPFKPSGDISFDAKAKQARGDAVKFLKSVTTCTSCHQKGHWYGDDACPNSVVPARVPLRRRSPVAHSMLATRRLRSSCCMTSWNLNMKLALRASPLPLMAMTSLLRI